MKKVKTLEQLFLQQLMLVDVNVTVDKRCKLSYIGEVKVGRSLYLLLAIAIDSEDLVFIPKYETT